MACFSSILHQSQIKHYHIVVFEISNWNWGDIVLEAHCYQFRNIKATISSSIKVSDWLVSSEFCWYQKAFSVDDLVNAEFVFLAIAITQTGALFKMFSWMNWFCLVGIVKVFCWILQTRADQFLQTELNKLKRVIWKRIDKNFRLFSRWSW